MISESKILNQNKSACEYIGKVILINKLVVIT